MQLNMLTLSTVMVTLVSMVSSSGVHTGDNTKDLMCDICQDIVRDLDEWITSDSTIDEIVHFADGVSLFVINTYFNPKTKMKGLS